MTTTSPANSEGRGLSAVPADGHPVDDYDEKLRTLSEGSVHRHFDPYLDIDWDDADFQVVPDDPRWILQENGDPLGRHPWYQALPEERKIEIGRWRQANVARVGLQFEELLIGGVTQYVFRRPNGSAEFRYLTHECIEECNHTLMFQEMVNRIGADVPGMRRWVKLLGPLIPLTGSVVPVWFFAAVLAGEEPIDHMQKTALRGGDRMHPIMHSVMAIHIAEEARHISFAHEFLRRRVPAMSMPSRFVLSIAFPITMRIACDIIVIPPPEFFRKFDIPKSVKRELFWSGPEARESLRDLFGDVRMLATDIGLMNPISRAVWKLCKIDGKPARYRGEPVRKAA
jgi:hypothetical protein